MAAPTDEEKDKQARMVMLTYGRMQDGKSPYWCYVAVKPSQYDRFTKTTKDGKLNLHTFVEDGFGEVLVSGPGLLPPPSITRDIAQVFNTPIKDLFGDFDPQAVISAKIEQMKKKAEE